MAAPIAVSSWITGVLSGSLGSTVLRLTISGRSGAAGSAACRSLSARRSIQMLLVLYQRQSERAGFACEDEQTPRVPVPAHAKSGQGDGRHGEPCCCQVAADRVQRAGPVVH